MRIRPFSLLAVALVPTLFAMQAGAAPVVVNSASEVGPGTTITNNMATTFVAGIVDFDAYSFSVDDPAMHALAGRVNAADLPFSTEDRVFFRESEAAMVPDPAGMRTGVADPSSMFIASVSHDFFRDVRIGGPANLTSAFLNGAEMGTDNWVYFSNNDSGNMFPSFWAQLNTIPFNYS